jgi:hypothetical protein
VLRGAEVVARGASMSAARAADSSLAMVNGAAGIVWAPAGRLQLVLLLTVSPERKVTEIDIISEPGRLLQLELALLPE